MAESAERSTSTLSELYLRALLTHDFEAFDEVLAPRMVIHSRFGDIAGRERFKALLRALRAAFPDITWTIDELIVTEARMVFRYSFEGTHLAPYLGIAATQKRVRIEGLELLHARDGWFVELWTYSDMMGLASQLHAPKPRGEGRGRGQ
jgi:predicted ester cyclase